MRAQCCIAGCGPAGAVLGLLLARRGVDVVVLEKHGDFLRDFRGDTLHPSVMEIMHELGLADRLLQLRHTKVPVVKVRTPDTLLTLEGSSEVRALLTVAADGRSSQSRRQAGLEPVHSSPPMDVLWFRLSRRADDRLRALVA